MRLRIISVPAVVIAISLSAAPDASAANLVASYIFNNTLSPQQGGAPALHPTDPQGANGFVTASVNGDSRTVYAFNGTADPAGQAGLTFDDSSNIAAPNSYSVEMMIELANIAGWRRLLDSQNRQSDNGFYIDPSMHLNVYSDSPAGADPVTAGAYENVILTVGSNTIKAYLNGALQFTLSDSQMNLNNANNPGQLLNLFLDNTVGGGLGEYSSGQIALFQVFDGVLSDSDAAALAANPFCNTAVPEPGAWALLAVGGTCLLALRKRALASSRKG